MRTLGVHSFGVTGSLGRAYGMPTVCDNEQEYSQNGYKVKFHFISVVNILSLSLTKKLFMIVYIKTPDNLPLKYETPGACAFDFKSINEVTFEPREWKFIETGTVIATPPGYLLQIQPRSGTFKNFGLMQVNSVGIIDQDYCGDNDTIKFAYINMRDEAVTVPAGTRIGQGVFVKIERAEFEVIEKMEGANRGGFGTTGNS